MKIIASNKASLLLGLRCLCTIILVIASLHAAEPTDAEIKALIEQLASSNEAPQSKGSEVVYPKNYDKAAQQKVWAAYYQLKAIGPRSYSLLMEHFDDQRYSLTGDLGSRDGNRNLGYICRWILTHQVCPFNPSVTGEGYNNGEGSTTDIVPGPRGKRPRRPDFVAHLLSNPETARKWAVERRNYPLKYIQCEALKWMIAEEAKDPKTYDLEERTALKCLLRELEDWGLHLESNAIFFSK